MIDTAGFTDKDSKRPEYRSLYEELPFIEAYSKHTDLRIEKDGPELAIGAKRDGEQDWDIHGKRQLDFLISRGLKPEHSLLDIGCGTGRLACKAVEYLDKGNYVGIDISEAAIDNCRKLIHKLFLTDKEPLFKVESGGLASVQYLPFHMIWAHSVFTHLPEDAIDNIFWYLSRMAFGEFCFTYKQSDAPRRSGLKQFQYPISYLSQMAARHGLGCEALPVDWPAGQKTARVYRG